MAHNIETRYIDYTQDAPPEWATAEEKASFYPKRAAKLICAEIRKAEEHETAQTIEETEMRASL